ncbi:SPOR domain-containing protein, partial [Methylorubrum suomiense]
APQRVASVAPESTASTSSTAAIPADPAPAAAQASVGGFSVQLGVRGSESEARAALKQMQAKYSQLSGKPELIRQAEVNGKTIYRVRVGPLAKNEASSLCTELQGAGGQCFVAKN